jgi:hypothetical protein
LLGLLHLAANALLLGIGYYWLGLGESRAATLAWSIAVASFLVLLFCWTYGAGLAYFRDPRNSALTAWRTSLRNLIPFAVAALAAGALLLAVMSGADLFAGYGFRLASYLSLKFHIGAKPSSIAAIPQRIALTIEWVVLPVLLLPMLSAISESGWRGFRSAGAGPRRRIYWIQAPVLLLIVVYLPIRLVNWVPAVPGFGMQVFSFAARALAAYLLFGMGWLLLAFVTSGGSPRATQPMTVVSP